MWAVLLLAAVVVLSIVDCFATDGVVHLLSGLSLVANGVAVPLDPAFGSSVFDAGGRAAYRAEVGVEVATIVVVPAFTLPGLTVSVGNTVIDREHPSATIPLAPGEATPVEIGVTRAIGGSATYEIAVTRVGLSDLTLTAGGAAVPLSFNAETLSYSVTVGAAVEEILVTPTVGSGELSVAVNGVPTSASQPAVAVSAAVAQSTAVTISVSGALGLSVTYQLMVNRAAAALSCSDLTVSLDGQGQYALTSADIAAITGLPQAVVASWQATPDAFDCACVESAPVSVSGTGPAGTQLACTATIHVVDDAPPVVAACPPSASVSLYGEEEQKLMPDLAPFLQASDNCGVAVIQDPAPGAEWRLGETAVNFRVVDPSGNEAPPCQALLALTDLPYWPMIGHNAQRTNASLLNAVASPWFVSAYPETKARQESGMRLELLPDFLLVGRAGTVFVRAWERDSQLGIVRTHLLAIDPEQATLMWSFPILTRVGFIPAIGDDGTVYCFDENSWLVGLDPEVPAGGQRVTWAVDLLSLLPPQLAGVLGLPPWEQFPGVWIPYWQPMVIGPEGNLYVSYRSFVFAFGPPPDRPLLWVGPPGQEWAAVSAGPGGVLYTHSWRASSLTIAAIGPNGMERWATSLVASPSASSYRSPAASIVTVGGNLVLPIAGDAGRHDLVVLAASDGRLLATYTLPPDVGETALLALGPENTLLAVTQTARRSEQGRTLALHALRIGEAEADAHLDLLWSTGLGDGWPDALVVDATETAFVCIRRASSEANYWNDDSELVIVHDGAVRAVLPVWGRVPLSPDVFAPGTNLALGKGGSLYRVAEHARTNDPGGRGTSLIKTVTPRDPVLSVLGIESVGRVGAPPIEFRFKLLLQDSLLRYRDYTMTWEFGDGTAETDHLPGDHAIGDTRRRLDKCHTYASLGTYPLRVTLRLEPEGLLVAAFDTAVCARLPEIRQVTFSPSGGSFVSFVDAADLYGRATLRAYVGQAVWLGCDVGWPCAGSQSVEWRFGDGARAAGTWVDHAYSRPGVYEVQIVAGESPLVSKRTLQVEVLPLPDLVVTAEPVEYLPGGLDVRLRVELSSVPPQLLSLTLDLGDGGTQSWQIDKLAHELYHTYTTPGTYTVRASVAGTDMRGEATVDYSLPRFSLRAAPASGFPPLATLLTCDPVVPGWPTNGLTYEWTIDNELIDEWTSEDGTTTHYGSPGRELPYRFAALGTHAITCYVYDPNRIGALYQSCAAHVLVHPVPEPPTPDGIRVPFPKDPKIASGSLCRWACGGDCPDTCVDHDDVVVWVLEPIFGGYYKFSYSGVIACGTHEGCRWHDDCFDQCAETFGESEAWEPCHMGCNAYVVDRYDAGRGYSWSRGYGPYDGWLLYSEPPTCEGPFPFPRE